MQDVFVDFIHSRPDLSAVRNLDGFLYTIVRNIHRSQLQKHLRRRGLLLSAVDYDSADMGLRAAGPARMLEIREQLYRVCQFACERKRSSKAGSLLILRFFHGYYPGEIATITRWDRATVDARLGLVRREARAYVEGPDRLRAIDGTREQPVIVPAAGFESEAVLSELRSRILAASEGKCLSESRIRELYRNDKLDAPGRDFLAHLVSCARCLEVVNRVLGLDSSSERGFGESDGPRPSAPTPIRRDNSRAKVSRWKRGATGISEHYPNELMIVVNGSPLAWQTVSAEHNEFSVRLPALETVEFIEIFSDQDVRLLSLAVPGSPPQVDLELRNEVCLSNNRTLSLALRFETLGPEVQVHYVEPKPVQATTPAEAPFAPARTRMRWWQALRPQLALLTIAGVVIVFLLLEPMRETSASAATLLMQTQAWERSAGTQSGLVVHRSLRLEERAQGTISHRRVEVWRDGRKDTRMRRLYDERGTLLASTSDPNTRRPAAASDAWRYEPSAENFELLAGELSRVKVADSGGSVRLTSAHAGVTIQKDNLHAIAGFVVVDGHEFQFTETAFELVRSEASPVVEAHPVASPETTNVAAVPHQAIDLEEIEMDSRYALHRIGADTGYPIEIRRTATGLNVTGVVSTRQRRDEIESALANQAVTFAIKTEEELTREPLPPTKTTAEIHVASARSPIDQQLLSYFGEPAAVERFTHAALSANESLMTHAWALRKLSERYPSATTLSADARRKLDEMKSDHRRAMSGSLRELTGVMEPALSSFGQTPRTSAAPATLFETAHQVEQLVLALVSGSGPAAQSPPEVLVQELLEAFGNLRNQLAEPY